MGLLIIQDNCTGNRPIRFLSLPEAVPFIVEGLTNSAMWHILLFMMAKEKDMQKVKTKKDDPLWTVKRINTKEYGTLFGWSHGGFAPLASQVIEIDIPETEGVWVRSLGLRLRNTEAVIDRLKDGLTIDSFVRLSNAMEISSTQLADVTSIALRTLARRKKKGRLHLAESERVFRVATLFDKAVEVLGDAIHARHWFKTPLKALGGKSPLEYSDTEIGAREVEDLLGRLEHGVFS